MFLSSSWAISGALVVTWLRAATPVMRRSSQILSERPKIAPQVRIRQDRDRRTDFETTRGGGVFFASIASGITGRGFDHIILDDPIAANDAQSAAERDRV